MTLNLSLLLAEARLLLTVQVSGLEDWQDRLSLQGLRPGHEPLHGLLLHGQRGDGHLFGRHHDPPGRRLDPLNPVNTLGHDPQPTLQLTRWRADLSLEDGAPGSHTSGAWPASGTLPDTTL